MGFAGKILIPIVCGALTIEGGQINHLLLNTDYGLLITERANAPISPCTFPLVMRVTAHE